MPSRQKRKVSLSAEIAELQARFTRIESFPNRSLNALINDAAVTPGSSFGPSATWASIMTAPYDAAFTLTRPQPVLALLSCGLFYGTGGTTLAMMRLALVSTFLSPTPAKDVNGNALVSGLCVMNSNDANGLGAGLCVIAATLPAGTYHTQAQYLYNAPGGSVFTVAGFVGPTQAFTVSVFTLAG